MRNLKYTFVLFYFVVSCLFTVTALAQNISRNFSNVKIDDLSDTQIRQIIEQAHAAGLTDNQIVADAENKGLAAAEAERLQLRITNLTGKSGSSESTTGYQQTSRSASTTSDSPVIARPGNTGNSPRIFGVELFTGANNSFEPNLKLATPVNYILGPEDQLYVNVYGRSLVNWKLTVSPEGNINLPSGGILNVAGQTIEQATEAIKGRLIAKNYAIGRGTEVKVTLGDIRSIKVIMVGEVMKPGTYTLTSLATAFNALYAAGGPTENGSLRQIEIIRNNNIIRRLDVYDFLVKGNQKDNIGLKDQDIIRIPSYQNRVEIAGEVKIPAIFEIKPNETLSDLIRFASGFTVQAYTSRIKVSQISDQKRRISEIAKADFKSYLPQPGDVFTVDKILNRYENRVTIMGAVVRAGDYELLPNMKLSQLIDKAAGVREDAFTNTGTITRLKADNTQELISFNVASVITKSTDIALEREDVVSIYSNFDLRDKYSVKISGEVRHPGDFAYADSMKVENLILMAGGFTEGASTVRIEVARRINDADPNSKEAMVAKVFSMDVDTQLKTAANNFTLKPFDIVLVYSLPGYSKQKLVHIEGEVLYPGGYVIQQKNERISDLIKRAGGLTSAANVNGSTLKRTYVGLLSVDGNKVDTNTLINEKVTRITKLKATYNDTSNVAADQFRNSYVGIDLKQIIDKPGSVTDLILMAGDVVSVPQEQQTVQVNGEVHLPSGVVFKQGKSFLSYISNAGGFSDEASKKGSYVVYPNGSVQGTRKFLFFNNYPDIKPGSEVYVPKKKPRRNGLTIGEVVGIISALGTTVLLGIIAIRR